MFQGMFGVRSQPRDNHSQEISFEAQTSMPGKPLRELKLENSCSSMQENLTGPPIKSCGEGSSFKQVYNSEESASSLLSDHHVRTVHRVSLRGKRQSPYKKVSEVQNMQASFWNSRNTLSAFSTLCFCCKKRRERSLQDRLVNRMTWMSLDGLLVNVNADVATSSRVVGNLDELEAAVWDSFAPLQRVLLVAITAAAAASAREQNSKELKRLQLAIDSRDQETEKLHEKIKCLQGHLSFWKERMWPTCNDTEHFEAMDGLGLMDKSLAHPNFGLDSTPKCASKLLEEYATPQLAEGLQNRAERQACCKDQEPCLNQCRNQHISGVSDFAECQPNCTLLAEDSPNWLVSKLPNGLLHCHRTPPNDFQKQNSQHVPYDQKERRMMNPDQQNTACNNLSSTAIFEFKNQVQQLAHFETPSVMTAFSSILDKMRVLESIPLETFSQSLTVQRQTVFAAVRDLRRSVEQASAQIRSLQLAVFGLWRLLEADMLGNDCFEMLTRDMELQMMRDDILSRRIDAEERRLSGMSDWSIDTSLTDGSCTEHQSGSGADFASAIEFAVKKTVDDLMAPLGRSQSEEAGGSSGIIIEQLLGELENAAAKVASMEMQMKALRESVKLSEREKEEAEQKRAYPQPDLNKQEIMKDVLVDSTSEASKYNLQDMTRLEEACRLKDQTIAKLEGKLDALQLKITELTNSQTPQPLRPEDRSSLPTFLTNNLLFNLDSPVKADSPQSRNVTVWKEVDNVPGLHEHVETKATGEQSEGAEMHSEEEDRNYLSSSNSRSKQHTEQRLCDNSGTSAAVHADYAKHGQSSGGNKEDSTSTVHVHYSQPRISSGQHPHKLRKSSAELRLSEVNNRRLSTADTASTASKHEGNLRGSGANVLIGVEPNTPIIKVKKFRAKDKGLSRSVDSLNKAKENFSQRPRWM